jgi:aminopeptidase N
MSSQGGPGRDVLYRAEAEARAARVQEASYELELELFEGRETYTGRVVITFALQPSDEPLFLDFSGRVRSVQANGTDIEPDHRQHRLWLAPERLGMHNRLVIDYENAYIGTGDGVHHFVDPEDGATYVYSNFEPFSAHRLFPCFDQPDIKAVYKLTVAAPASWKVVTSEEPIGSSLLAGGRRLHEFHPSGRFSTYLLPLVAGPWVQVSDGHRGVPLGLFGRASMRAELERSADEIFEVTAQGLDYYADLFGRPYPFSKYDQLFVPEFNAGAMENVGAVTFHDSFLFRDPPTYGQRLTRGEVVLHELAHMWFGDLVTMRWWDDLWLNETFATYMSYRALADATRFDDAWRVFNGQMRPAAYRQDQLATTHPVATTVEHTDQAVGNFDAITYEKGAAVIKQLVARIGEEAFRNGLHAYIDRHAFGNATLADFLGALGEAAGEPLEEWARLWLQTASLNVVGAEWDVADGRISGMTLNQRALPGQDLLRPHTTAVGLVSAAADGSLTIASIPATIEGPSAGVPDAVGRPEPLFVFPNHGDHDYALAQLDPVSTEFALERLPDLPDPLLRQQTWSTLWEMVRAVTLRSTDFLEAVRRWAPAEHDRSMVDSVVARASVAQRRYLPESIGSDVSRALTRAAIEAAHSSTDPDLELTWARTAVALASDRADIAELLSLVDSAWSSMDGEPDQLLRWNLAIKAVAYGLPGALERVEDERARDPSDRGQRASIRATVSQPDAEAKGEAWARINGEGYGSDYLTRAAIAGFQWPHQRELTEPFRSDFYARVADVYGSRDHAYAESYLRWLVPDLWAEPDEAERIRRFAAGLDAGQELLQRHLIEVADDMERDIRVRAFASVEPALVC